MYNSDHDPFCSPISYAPTDKDSIDKALAAARRMLTPHVLVLHLLYSRLQAARYYQPNIMFLIQQLVLRSARNYKRFRYCFPSSLYLLHSPNAAIAPTHWPVNLGSLFCCSDLRHSEVLISMHIARIS